MKISSLSALPEIADRQAWARLLEINESAFYTAEKQKQLKIYQQRGYAKRRLYTRQDILDWLGIPLELTNQKTVAAAIAQIAISLKSLPVYRNSSLEELIPIAHELLQACEAELERAKQSLDPFLSRQSDGKEI
jgi:DNA-binding transcriptional MerR regulator